jgi:hypothetical protein
LWVLLFLLTIPAPGYGRAVPDRPLVHRRAVVTGLAATVLAAGCDTGDEIAPPEQRGGPSAASEPEEAPEQTPDQVLVDEVVAELLGAIDLLSESRKKAPALRPSLTPILRAHRQHVRVLQVEGEYRTSTSIPADAAAALRAVRRSERRLHVTLVDAAGRAESGALARLLASISASVTQHLTLLAPEVAS